MENFNRMVKSFSNNLYCVLLDDLPFQEDLIIFQTKNSSNEQDHPAPGIYLSELSRTSVKSKDLKHELFKTNMERFQIIMSNALEK